MDDHQYETHLSVFTREGHVHTEAMVTEVKGLITIKHAQYHIVTSMQLFHINRQIQQLKSVYKTACTVHNGNALLLWFLPYYQVLLSSQVLNKTLTKPFNA